MSDEWIDIALQVSPAPRVVYRLKSSLPNLFSPQQQIIMADVQPEIAKQDATGETVQNGASDAPKRCDCHWLSAKVKADLI